MTYFELGVELKKGISELLKSKKEVECDSKMKKENVLVTKMEKQF